MSKYSISIDLGGTNTKVALVSLAYSIKDKTSFATQRFTATRNALIGQIVSAVRSLLRKYNLHAGQLAGIGIGVPGLVDFPRGVIYYLPNIPHWKQTPIRAILQKKFHCPVCVDNDVHLMTLAESRLGAAQGFRHALCLTLGTGVGGGIIIDGRLYRGSRFCAGEIGHIPIIADGLPCNCGGRGCFERYVGNRHLLRIAQQKFRSNKVTLEQISDRARAGNKKAKDFYRKFAQTLGIGLTGVVNFLNPEVIVIGGGLSYAGSFIFPEIKKTILKRAMPIQAQTVKIKKAALGNDAGLIGAALLVREASQ